MSGLISPPSTPDRLLRRCAAFGLACLVSGLGAAVAAEIPAARLGNFTETLDSDVKVGGIRIIAGATTIREDRRETTLEPLLLVTPASKAYRERGVCVETRSKDGRYYSKGSLQGGQIAAPFTRIQSQSAYEKELKSLGPLELTVLAFAGDCAHTSKDTRAVYVVDRGRDPGSAGGTVRLFVNSERLPTTIEYPDGANQLRRSGCRSIEAGSRTTFDAYCDLDDLARGETSVTIQRKRYERQLPPLTIVILHGNRS